MDSWFQVLHFRATRGELCGLCINQMVWLGKQTCHLQAWPRILHSFPRSHDLHPWQSSKVLKRNCKHPPHNHSMVLLLITPMRTRWKETLKYLGEIKGLCFEGDSLVDAKVKKTKQNMESSTKMKLPSKYALGEKSWYLSITAITCL